MKSRLLIFMSAVSALVALTALVRSAAQEGPATQEQIRSAATRALGITGQGAAGFYKFMVCSSCHDHAFPLMAWQAAREHGIPVDEALATRIAAKGLLSTPNFSSIDVAVQGSGIIDPAPADGWALVAAHAAGVQPNLVTEAYARRVAKWQRQDGHWPTLDARPPQSYSLITATAVAAHAVQLYMPAQVRHETDERLARAQAWLLAAEPQSTEDSTYRLLGLYWTRAGAAETKRAATDLLALQRPDGGWAELPHMQPDAYSTGEVLVALNEGGGVPATDPAWQKGLRYLLSTQGSDGAWHVHTRQVSPAAVSPPYFESGFPYAHDQYISTAGTCWAAMALMLALPRVAAPDVPQPLTALAPKGLELWMETALFGTTAELKAQLDARLDPNSKTAEGTTLLMMVAPDAEKVKLLIDRGADVRARAKSGFTALIVAATYLGSSESVKLLLEHGAEARPGEGVMFDASPLFFAAEAGDQESVSLLLTKGANPNRKMRVIGMFPTSPLLAAVTFGDPVVVKELLSGGADIREKDDDGMTDLHWAVVTHHPESARALLAAGADANAVDRFGYTPLLYAATIDFGDAATVAVLTRAGADPNVKDKTGKTALARARDYPYLRAALEKAGARQ
jgi:ankyrin repeat protein